MVFFYKKSNNKLKNNLLINRENQMIFPGDVGVTFLKKQIDMLLESYLVHISENELDEWNGFSLLDLFFFLEIDIPVFCYHESLSISGNCRMCIVEVTTSKVLNVSCCILVLPEMSAFIDSIAVNRSRISVLEFLLINHPLDCPICDQGGECDLQDISFIFGSDLNKFPFIKRLVQDFEISPLISTIMTRCIHCTRCIRYFDEIVHLPILGTFGRGNDMIIGSFYSFFIDSFSNLIGNVVDICPVGALTSKVYSFIARPWEIETIPSFIFYWDAFGIGVNIDICSDRIYRILPRLNSEKKYFFSEFIPDYIRYNFKIFFKNRIFFPLICFYLLLNEFLNFYNEKMNKYFCNISWLFSFYYFSISFFFFFNNYNLIGLTNHCSLSSFFFFDFFILLFGGKSINLFSLDNRGYFFHELY